MNAFHPNGRSGIWIGAATAFPDASTVADSLARGSSESGTVAAPEPAVDGDPAGMRVTAVAACGVCAPVCTRSLPEPSWVSAPPISASLADDAAGRLPTESPEYLQPARGHRHSDQTLLTDDAAMPSNSTSLAREKEGMREGGRE